MKPPKDYAKELVEKMYLSSLKMTRQNAKTCAIVLIENECYALREQLFNLRSCKVIQSENVYLFRIQELIHYESKVKTEIINLK